MWSSSRLEHVPTALAFTKGHGTGNDFVLVADPQNELTLSPEQRAWLCDRHFGVGADGVIRAVRTEHSAEVRHLLDEDASAEWFMDYTNSDGSLAEMCGNGARVFVHYLRDQRLIEAKPGDTVAIATRAGIRDVLVSEGSYQVDLGRWRLESEDVLVSAANLDVPRPGLGLSLGNPHVAVALADPSELYALTLTSAPNLDPAPPHGANVEFIVPEEPLVKDGVARISMRVFERGVGETLSCGTGVAAAALAFRHWAPEGTPNAWRVRVPGGVLAVRMFATEEGEHVSLSGPAELSFSGHVDVPDL